jgi:hypothetical protein
MLALVTGCALRVEAQPSQADLVERASAYVSRFLAAFVQRCRGGALRAGSNGGTAAAHAALGARAGTLSGRERLARLP